MHTPVGAQRPGLSIPHLDKRGTATQLVVDGKPFLVLGGELHNSSSSSLDYLEPILAKLATVHPTRVLAAVDWEILEPEEARFDFKMVDDLIQAARRNHRPIQHVKRY